MSGGLNRLHDNLAGISEVQDVIAKYLQEITEIGKQLYPYNIWKRSEINKIINNDICKILGVIHSDLCQSNGEEIMDSIKNYKINNESHTDENINIIRQKLDNLKIDSGLMVSYIELINWFIQTYKQILQESDLSTLEDNKSFISPELQFIIDNIKVDIDEINKNQNKRDENTKILLEKLKQMMGNKEKLKQMMENQKDILQEKLKLKEFGFADDEIKSQIRVHFQKEPDQLTVDEWKKFVNEMEILWRADQGMAGGLTN